MSLLNRLRHRAIGQAAVYGSATGMAAVLTLVQTRVLWRVLTPADFGVWALVDPLLFPLTGLVLFGIDQAIVKQLQIDRMPLRVVVGTLLTSTLPASGACLALIGVFGRYVFNVPWTAALLCTLAGEALALVMQTAFRARGSAFRFAALLLSRNLLYLGVLLLVRSGNDGGLMPVGLVFLARGICVLLVSVVALAALRPLPRIDWPDYRDALRYGFPLLLTSFVYSASDMVDRWLLAEFSGVVVVGVYTLHLKTAAIMAQAIVVPFGLWFPAERFRRMEAPDQGYRFFRRVAAGLTVLCAYVSGGVWLSRDVVLPLIAPGVVASPLILACCLGTVMCLAISHALNVGLLLPGHTGKNVWCSVAVVVAAGLACGILVPILGADGAALGRISGGVVLLGVTGWWSYRVLPIRFPLAGMLLFCGASALIAVLIDDVVAGRGLLPLAAALLVWTAVIAGLGGLLWLSLSWGRGAGLPTNRAGPHRSLKAAGLS